MKRYFIVIFCLVVTTRLLAFVPLTNKQLNLGSFREDATCGMFYDELDIISAYPVSLLDYSGNTLYTTWGNVRNPVDILYNPIFKYGESVDNTFVLGIVGDPFKKFGIVNSRAGFVFQNFGTKSVYFNLDNNVNTGYNPGVNGYDSEGKWQDVYSQDLGGDYQFDYQETYDASLKYYDSRAINQFNIGFAKKKLLPSLNNIEIVGISVARQSDYTRRLTEGVKSYKERALNDNGLPAGWPSGTRILDTYELTYAKNDILTNSFDQTDLFVQARTKGFVPGLRLDVGVGLRIRDDYNPNGLEKTAHRIVRSLAKLNNAGNAVLYDTGEVVRNVVDYIPGGVKELNYDDFANLLTKFQAMDIWRPQWAGGRDLPGLYDFQDDRRGLGILARLEAEYKLFGIPTIGVFNLSIVPQKIDSKQVWKDYVMTKTYDTTQANNPLATWVARDYVEEIKDSGDIVNTAVDFGIKLDLVKAAYLEVSLGGFITSLYKVADYKTKTNSVEITSYDDGISGNNPGNVNLNNRPSATNGEGVWEQTVESETSNKDEVFTSIISVPIGAEIPITKKWVFRAGTVYNRIVTTQIVKRTAGIITTVTEVTPAGEPTIIQKEAKDPTTPNLNESVYYTETHSVRYTYGIEWKPNPNLIVACNAFLDTNTNPVNGKASIFDLDTYRLLALQVVFKF